MSRGGKCGEHRLLEAAEAALAPSELLGDAVVIGVDELDELRVMEALLGLQSADLVLELERRVMPHVHLPREERGRDAAAAGAPAVHARCVCECPGIVYVRRLQLRIGPRSLCGDGSDLAELLPLPELARFGTRYCQLLAAPVERLVQRA